MNSVKEIRIGISDPDRWCDAANMNAFLMPYDVFRRMGVFDRHYTHKMADYDYCFGLKRIGVKVYMTDYYAGLCEIRTKKGTWEDRELSRIKRLRLKEQPKGLPAGGWFYFLLKEFRDGVCDPAQHYSVPEDDHWQIDEDIMAYRHCFTICC